MQAHCQHHLACCLKDDLHRCLFAPSVLQRGSSWPFETIVWLRHSAIRCKSRTRDNHPSSNVEDAPRNPRLLPFALRVLADSMSRGTRFLLRPIAPTPASRKLAILTSRVWSFAGMISQLIGAKRNARPRARSVAAVVSKATASRAEPWPLAARIGTGSCRRSSMPCLSWPRSTMKTGKHTASI